MSLRVRLLLTTVLILGIVIAALALLSGRASVSEFREFVEVDTHVQLDRSGRALSQFYHRRGSWTGVDSVLRSISRVSGEQLILVGGEGGPIAAADLDLGDADVTTMPDGTLICDVEETVEGMVQHRRIMLKGPHVRLHNASGTPVGILYQVPPPVDPFQRRFEGGVNRRMIVVVALAALIGIALTLAVSQRIVKPIEELTAAARRMQAGDFSHRVAAGGSDEVGTLARAMNEMADDIERVESLRRQMVTDVAHELRTPLTNIRCQLEALQDGIIGAEPAVIDSLHDEVLHLNRLIDDLQDLAVAEGGELSLLPAPVDLSGEVRRALTALEPRARAAGVRLRAAIPDDMLVHADPRRLGQVLRNLLDNALTHTPEAGFVEVEASRARGEVEVRVRDSGVGIPVEHLPFVFERFYRADPSRSRDTGGFGLGLSIVKQLVEAHGGRVGVTSVVGEGTTFTFTLPEALTEGTPPPAADS